MCTQTATRDSDAISQPQGRESDTVRITLILASFVFRSSFVCVAAIAYLLETADAVIE